MIRSRRTMKNCYSSRKIYFGLNLIVIIGLLLSMVGVASLPAQPAAAAGGDFSLDFTAAGPFSYDHSTGGGAYNDRTIDKSYGVVESLEGGDYFCGDIVTFLTAITVGGDGSDDPQTIQLDFSFGAQPTGQPGVGYVDVTNVAVNYGFVENGGGGGAGTFGLDTGIVDDGGSTTSISEDFYPSGTVPFGTPPAEKILLTVEVDDLEAGEQVILRVDVRLACDDDPSTSPTGNVQAAIDSAGVVDPVQDSINVGQQTISLKNPGAVEPPPECTIIADPTPPICAGVSVTLTAGPSNGYLYLWTPGDAITQSITVTPLVTTTYTVTVTDDATGLFTQCSIEVVVNPNPTVALSGEDSFCDDSSTLITATPSGGTAPYSYDWSASTASGTANDGTYTATGSGTVAVTVTDFNGCTGSDSMPVTENISPTVALSGEDSFCDDSSTLITATPSGGTAPYSYDWSASTATGTANDGTYTATGSGTVAVTVTDFNGCTGSDSMPVTENISPDCTIDTPLAVIGGSTHTASVAVPAATPATYTWAVTGDGNLVSTPPYSNSITWTAGPSGTVHIEVTIEDANGCSSTCEKDVIITECFIDAEASNSGPVCQGEPVQLFGEPIGGTPPYEYSWSGPLGFSSTQQNPIRSPAVAGTYTLVVTDADECTGFDTTLVVVNPLPDCTITAPSPVFPGSTNTASVPNAGLGAQYAWSVTGEGTLTGGQNTPSITWTAGAEGTVTISVTVTDANGCESSCIRTVTVRTPPPPPPPCSPDIQLAVLLDGSSTMNSTEWQIQLDGLSEAILDTECMPDCYVELTVIQFAGEIWGDARTEVPPTVINSDNRDEVAQAVLDIEKSAGITPMEAGIDRAVNRLSSSIYFSPALKQIINISSDVQENTLDRPAIEEARDNAIAAGIDEISAEGVGDFRIPEDQDWMQNRIVHPGFPTGTGNIAPYSWDPGWVYAVGTDADKFKEAICHKIGLTNYAPVALDDAYSVKEDTTRNVAAPGILANDTDADGDTLTAILVSDVGHGTLTLNSNGSFSYTPSASFTGPDSFTYKANDGKDDSNVATVTITVSTIGPGPGPAPITYTVILPAGINVDPVAFNLIYYDGVEVTLPTGTEPPELIAVYYYDPVALELLYYFPGWPSTMTQLEHGKVYLVIVSDACQWPIPQP